MMKPSIKNDLIPFSKKEKLKTIEVIEIAVYQWYDLDCLSFNISKVEQVSDSQLLELTFIFKLINNCEIKLLLHYLLSKLQKNQFI
jgi:hypothetical protein